MELLATYTFGQALLTVLELALLFLWIWIAVTVLVDIFRSHDLSGWAKAGWIVLIVLEQIRQGQVVGRRCALLEADSSATTPSLPVSWRAGTLRR